VGLDEDPSQDLCIGRVNIIGIKVKLSMGGLWFAPASCQTITATTNYVLPRERQKGEVLFQSTVNQEPLWVGLVICAWGKQDGMVMDLS